MSRLHTEPTPRAPIAPIAFALVATVCVAFIGALAAVTFWTVYSRPSERVAPGVSVADVPVGGVSQDELRDVIGARLSQYADTPIAIALPDGGRHDLRAAELGYRPELAATLAQVAALGTPPKREVLLAEWTGGAPPQSIRPAFSVDQARLDAAIGALAAKLDRPAVDAQLEVNPDVTVRLTPGQTGQRLDRQELARQINQAFRELNTQVSAPVETVAPAVSDEAARSVQRTAEKFLAAPLEVRVGDHSWPLSRGDLASWVVFDRTADGELQLGLHPERPRNWLVDRAQEVNRPARDARVKLQNGKVVVAAPDEPGLQLNRQAAIGAILAGGLAPERIAELPARKLAPAVTAADAAKLTFPDLLTEASTLYGGSIPERDHNVELAAARLDGVVVPPGAVFSFNDSIGRTRLKDGYQMAFGIMAGADGVQTVPSVAGGICQVATTLFHSVFWAGLPIEERHYHPYWIPKYGTPPKGMTGLDATVDEDSGLDLQFKNTTGAPILVQASTDGNAVVFHLRGTKPDWKVAADGPKLDAFVKADHTFVRQEDPTLAAGRAIQIEEARDGFTSAITRTVTKGDQVLDRLELKSQYAPSRNVVLVGTKR